MLAVSNVLESPPRISEVPPPRDETVVVADEKACQRTKR
jgi:hypothetical protein